MPHYSFQQAARAATEIRKGIKMMKKKQSMKRMVLTVAAVTVMLMSTAAPAMAFPMNPGWANVIVNNTSVINT